MSMKRFTLILLASVLAWSGCGKDEGASKPTEQQATQPPAAKPAQPAQPGAAPAQPGAVPAQPGAAPAQPGAAAGDPMAKAKQIFSMQCAMCHGPTGHGDGPAAANLNPKPRNHSDKTWQASVTDERIAEVIVKGGQGVGLSPLMPANPQLAGQPEVVNALVQLIRSFAAE